MNEFEEGVFLVGANGTYALFVEMDDHVVAVGDIFTNRAGSQPDAIFMVLDFLWNANLHHKISLKSKSDLYVVTRRFKVLAKSRELA